MNITKSNLRDMRNKINEAIDKSLFIAIDGEFTGLDSNWDTEHKVNIFNTPSEYYKKVVDGALDFLMVQLGLCMFHYDKETETFKNTAFNILIFPSQGNFLFHCSTLRFLDAHGFDFTQMIREGIPVLTAAQAEKKELKKKPASEAQDVNGAAIQETTKQINIPADNKQLINDVLKDFSGLKEGEELEIRPLNAFLRKLIYQETAHRHPNVVLESRQLSCGNRRLFARKRGKPEDEKRRQEAKELEDELKHQDAIWLVTLMKTLSTSGKLLVGHNMFLDICHILKYLWPTLPNNYDDFKSLCHTGFPKLLDTKAMASFVPFKENIKSTILKDILVRLKQPPYSIPECLPVEPNCGYDGSENREHEAAYDAYITGLCFLGMCKHLDSLKHPEDFLLTSDKLKPYLNKINLNRLIDSPYTNLSGEDLATGRDHVFHCTFPAEWKVQKLRDLFKSYGNVDIAWLNDTSALVGLRDKKMAPKVKNAFKLKRKLEYTIKPWNPDAVSDNNLKNMSPIQKRRSHSIGRISDGRPSFPKILEENEEEETDLGTIIDNRKQGEQSKQEKNQEESSPKHKRFKKVFEENDDWD